MSAKIARIYKNTDALKDGTPNPNYQPDKPACWMEYLKLETNQFVVGEDEATVFPSHGEADALCIVMRAKGEHGYVFAVACHREPPPPSITHRPPRQRRETDEQHMPTVKLFGYGEDD